MRYAIIVLFLPALLGAQEFEFQQEYDTIPVEINGWCPYQPWVGGYNETAPDFCDIDSDNDLDLFIGQSWKYIDYYRNQGSSTLANFVLEAYQWDSISCFPNNSRTNPDFADLDGDGDQDLLIGAGYVRYYRNEGTPFLPDFTGYEDTLFTVTGNWVFGTHVALVDIDADQDADLICGEYQGHLQFYRNIGTPDSFTFYLESNPWLGINVGDDADPTLCDIDQDGDFDLFVGNEDGKIYYYRNDGDSVNYNFTYVTNYYNNIDVDWYASPEFADIDGDGDYDLFIGREQMSLSTSSGDIFFYENVGTSQVAQWNLVTKNYISLDVGYTAQSTTTDIDADQDRDLFIQHIGARLSYYQNIGTPDSSSYRWVTDSYQDISVTDAYPKFCDIDGDQDPDLFMGEAAIPGPPGLFMFKNRGTSQNAQFVLYSSNLIPNIFTQGSVSLAPALADIDNDNDYDLFICDQDTFYMFPNIGNSTQPLFGSPVYNWQNLIPPGGQCPSCFYDIDQDGDLDLFWGMLWIPNQLWFFRNVGNSQSPQMVLETQTFLGESFYHFNGVDIFDIDQDGDGDFMLSTSEGGMVFYRNVTGQSPVDPHKRPVPTYPTIDLSLQPNPGNPVAIVLSLPSPQPATLAVYNLLGAKVATLTTGLQPAGQQRYFWETTPFASGVYLVRLEARKGAYAPGGETLTKKLTVIK